MKYLFILSAFFSLNAFSASDSCPPHQSLRALNENYDLWLKSNINTDGEINLRARKSKVPDSPVMTLNSHHLTSVYMKKGDVLNIGFTSTDFYNNDGDQYRKSQGVLLKGNDLIGLDFIINDSSSEEPTVKDLETVLGDSFTIDCSRKIQASEAESIDRKSSVGSQQ
jgi:hypothetical protein